MFVAFECQAVLDVGVAADRRAEDSEPLLGWRERPIPDPHGGVSLALQCGNARRLLACRVPDSRLIVYSDHPRASHRNYISHRKPYSGKLTKTTFPNRLMVPLLHGDSHSTQKLSGLELTATQAG